MEQIKTIWNGILTALGWLLFIVLFITGFSTAVTSMPIAGVIIMAVGIVLSPPLYVRFKQTKFTIKHVMIACVGIISLSLLISSISESVETTHRQEEQKIASEHRAEELKLLRQEFESKQEQTISKLQMLYDESKYEDVVSVAQPYVELNDPDINELHNLASNEINKAEQEKQEYEEAQKYVEFLKTQIADLKSYSVDQFLDDKDSILIASAVYSAMAMHLDEANRHDLNGEQKQVVAQFRNILKDRQLKDLPRLRDAYGPAARKALWVKDISVKTLGNGYRTIEFAGGLFALNSNIASFHAGLVDLVEQLRFKQVNYKWYKEASEYTYFKLDSPSDADIVIFEGSGYRKVD